MDTELWLRASTAEKAEAVFKRERQQLVALDWDTDIAPLLEDKDNVSIAAWFGMSVSRLVDSMKFTIEEIKKLTGHPHSLLGARQIVFELSIHPDYEFPMTDLGILSDFLTQLPNNPDIVWGLSRDPKQELPLTLNILYTTK